MKKIAQKERESQNPAEQKIEIIELSVFFETLSSIISSPVSATGNIKIAVFSERFYSSSILKGVFHPPESV
ncbi:MAG: hypothetical protein IPH18_14585 [Chitinophagaceae bacterium]|nr:hypothetical protein [Chitinophagaceae bacterium]